MNIEMPCESPVEGSGPPPHRPGLWALLPEDSEDSLQFSVLQGSEAASADVSDADVDE